ncbi:hypothetical protein C0J52_17391, partial [Blattella germanica]
GLLPRGRGTTTLPPSRPSFLDNNLQGHWIGRRGPFEFPGRSPDLTPMEFYLWRIVKDQVHRRKPRTQE